MWREYQRALAVHADMEDNELFVILNSPELGNGIITTEKLPGESD